MRELSEARPRVLFAEDEAERNRRVVDVLRLEGFEVDVASTVAECVSRLRAGRYDVVLYDIMMPLGDGETWEGIDPIDAGIALLTKWRDGELEGLPEELPVVVLTGTTRHREVLQTLGVAEYLEKPCGLREVVKAVRAAAAPREATP
ncbi:MAG: response regulator [Armatimonadetes bacterium]|nr:response regulator [Armatimonadota bacterium]